MHNSSPCQVERSSHILSGLLSSAPWECMWMAIGMGCMGETLEELSENMREAIDLVIESIQERAKKERIIEIVL